MAATIALRQKSAEESQEVQPVKVDAQKVVAPKMLINEGDWLEFRLLVDGGKKPVQVRGRIAGFNLTRYTPYWRIPLSFFLSAGAAIVSATILIAFSNTKDSPTVPVPNVSGKPLQQAVAQINNAGLKLGTVNRIRSAATVGTVIFESPVSGQKVDKNTTITLVVSDGP